MKTTFVGKTARQSMTMSQPDASTGQNVISLAPPDYGIEFVDHELTADRPEGPTVTYNKVQGHGGNAGFYLNGETADRIDRARGGGKPLDERIQVQLGNRIEQDFNGIRLHTDMEADALSQRLMAKAFTVGSHIFFRRGMYNPHTGRGRALIAHELTHVVQQASGRVKGGWEALKVMPANDGFENEAQSAAWISIPPYPYNDGTFSERLQNPIRGGRGHASDERSGYMGTRAIHGAVVQRDCWTLSETQLATFDQRPEHRPDWKNLQYYRFQADKDITTSEYFAPVLTPKAPLFEAAKKGVIPPEFRQSLAVLHEWSPEWKALVVYKIIECKGEPFFGSARPQCSVTGQRFTGGATQAVIPTPGRMLNKIWESDVKERIQP